MKKIIAMLICAVLSIGIATAQNSKTYTGFVVDKNGNPVVGAEVMAPGGGVSAITDSDGSFTIEVPFMLKKLTASYAGMNEKSLKLGKSSNLVFKMKALKKRVGFISFVGNIGVISDRKTGRDYEDVFYESSSTEISGGAGVMGGQIGQLSIWGWYVKGMGFGGVNYFSGGGSFTAGAIIKLGSNAHLYFGGGVAFLESAIGYSFDLGTIFTVGSHVNIISGLNYTNGIVNHSSHEHTYDIANLNIGVGYTF